MNPRPPATNLLKDPDDFSFVLGGPLYQLFRRAHLSGTALQLLHRRVLVLSSLAWVPLLVLSVVEGRAWGSAVKVPFLHDIDMHVRFLAALPLFVVAELVVHMRTRTVIRQFLERGLIPDDLMPRFVAAVNSAMRLRNSVVAELLLIAFVYLFGVGYMWRSVVTLSVGSWSAVPVGESLQPTWAGWWFGCVSLPFFQFILLRWYFRIIIWMRFLWQVSRIGLRLVPTHPDRVGGLGFLSNTGPAFAPLLLGQGALLAGTMANRIIFDGEKLVDLKGSIIAIVVAAILVVVAPLLVFAPVLARVKRTGLREYGALAESYVQQFDQKWLRGGAPPGEPLVGSADIQSLADLGNSFEVVRTMRFVPITRDAVIQLLVVTLAPLTPLLLTMMSPQELLNQLLKVLF